MALTEVPFAGNNLALLIRDVHNDAVSLFDESMGIVLRLGIRQLVRSHVRRLVFLVITSPRKQPMSEFDPPTSGKAHITRRKPSDHELGGGRIWETQIGM